MRTSESHPIRVDFIEDDRYPALNRLGMTFAPGKKQADAATGEWDRDLEEDAGRLQNFWRVDLLVSLLEDHELESLSIPDLVSTAGKAGIEVVRFPVADVSIPRNPLEFANLVEEICTWLKSGSRVVAHCKGGLGRAGMTAACCAVAVGEGRLNGEEAVEIVRKARKGAVETREQEAFVGGFWSYYSEATT